MVRRDASSLTALLLLAAVAAGGEPWGLDNNPGDGPRLIEEAAPELARIVNAPEEARPKLVADYVAGKAGSQIEAVKRFRNADLLPLFQALAGHPEWKVRHRALFALEYFGDPDALPLAFAALRDPEPRLREKAAIAAIKLWSPKAAKGLEGDPAKAVDDLLGGETDPHVATCLRALRSRIGGKLLVRKVYEEHVEKRPDGLLLTPFLSGMNTVGTVAPNYVRQGISESGGGSAARLPDGPWTTPLVLFGQEARAGMSLQPFANLRGEGGTTYHTGLDVGACMDGAGYYAIAPGIVRFVYTGSDMGTEIVVQHHLGDKRTVNAIYMHGGDTVFVKGGDRVECGQLLGTMGMSFSIENGGHYAHLHFGLYPGEFATTHNYGYRAVKAGLVDWYDPAHYVPLWAELSRPPSGEGDLERAVRMRDQGYPTRALEFLEEAARAAKGSPVAEELAAAAKEWKADRALKEAMKGEAKILATEDRALALVGKPEEAKALWEALLGTFEGTCLAPRIRAFLR